MAIVWTVVRALRSKISSLELPGALRHHCISPKQCFYSTTPSKEEYEHKDDSTNNGMASDTEEIKLNILNAALEFVTEQGWSRQALASGAEKIGYPGVAHGMFPQGAAELVHHFYYTSNRNLERHFKSEEFQQNINQSSENKEKVFLRNALETRLRMIIPYINKWPQAMAIMSIPQNIPNAIGNLQDLVDTIWYYAGDKSVDLSWYGKRVGLSLVYKTTELCLLQDTSDDDYSSTWLFLDRRIADYITIERCIKQMGDTNQILAGGLITVKNILGIGRRDR